MRELIVDSFAGGGGASAGIEMALGRSPDIAINHDAAAMAVHAANHPSTLHLSKNIWQVDPIAAVGHRPVGLLWASPDCKHFSKAKGGKPVKRSIRDLAWVVVLWARRARPRVIILENVEEFREWGPLVLGDDGGHYPDPERRGETFDRWVGELRRLGYRVAWRELRACDYGAPTIRKRLFLIARRDGGRIVWPEPTHADPKSESVKSGRLKPWRTAAEIIDWSLPCPSIFETGAEIFAKHGVRAKRPLAPATLARIARGVKRYVLDAARPFIVPVTHAGDLRSNSIDEPLRTQTTAHRGEHALVTPFVTKFNRGATGHAADEPLHTITAAHSETHPGGAAPLGVVVPCLVPRYGERPGQEPRVQSVDTPLSTIVPTGNGAQLVAPHLMTMRNAGKPFEAADRPMLTITAGGAHPHLVAAFLAQHNSGMVGHAPGEPVSTIVGKGCTQGVVAAHLSHAYSSNTAGGEGSPEKPVRTIVTGGHAALVASFMVKYYGQGVGQAVDEPAHTLTTRDRHGLITVTVAGETPTPAEAVGVWLDPDNSGKPELYVVVDIGMRMLTPRERFNVQGFPPDYIIDTDFEGRAVTGETQGRLVGNSVCPPIAAALVAANCPDLAVDAADEAAA